MPDQLYYPKRHGEFVVASYSEVPTFSKLNPQDFCHKELPLLGTGKGVKVVVLGSGVADHKYLRTAIASSNLGPSDQSSDINGHSHVVGGIIAANDEGSIIGVARDASLFFAKVTDDEGVAPSIAVAAGLLWAVAISAQVVVLSVIPDVQTDLFLSAVKKAVDSNVIIVMDGTADGVGLPSGIVSTAGMKFPEKLICSTFLDNTFVDVKAADFSPAIAGGIAALLVERVKSADKKSKASTMSKQIMAILKG